MKRKDLLRLSVGGGGERTDKNFDNKGKSGKNSSQGCMATTRSAKITMRFHDVIALAGLAICVVGLGMTAFRPGHRLAGMAIAAIGLAVLAYGASFL